MWYRTLRRRGQSPAKWKIFFAGIDGSGKSTCLDLLIANLDGKYRIMKINKTEAHICFRGEKQPALKYQLNSVMESLRRASMKYHFYSVFCFVKFVYKRVLSSYLEHFAETDIIVYDGDVVLHPSAYGAIHFPMMKWFSVKMRIAVARLLFGLGNHSLIVYLDVDPIVAMERIRGRGGDIHGHENPETLEKLKREFERILASGEESGVRIVRIDSNSKCPKEIIEKIKSELEGIGLRCSLGMAMRGVEG